ncbi:MAG: radical SAM protein [Candidatus Woesearchaeota archaeon]
MENKKDNKNYIKEVFSIFKNIFLEDVIDANIDYVRENPEKNIDYVINRLDKKLKNTKGEQFVDWVRNNPGPREFFINLFKKDKKQVNVIIKNLILYSGVDWIKKNKKLDPEKEFPAPFTLLISPTMACNLQCEGCYAISYDKSKDMSKEFFDDIITQAEEMGTHFFTLLGGEPSLKIVEFYDVFRKHKNSIFQMFTNGTYLNRNKKSLEALIDLKNIIPVLSVDGTEEETNELRGRGVYNEVVSLANRLASKNFAYGISLVLTSTNYKTLSDEKFYDEWIDRGAMFGWIFLYMPISKYSKLELMPTPQQRKSMYDVVNYVRNNKPFFLMDFWNDAPAIDGCIAARRYAHVNNEGYLEPCIFVHLATHNLHEVSLKEAWNSDYFKAIRLNQPHTDNLLMPCMIIDNPEVLRKIINKYNPIATDGYEKERIFEIAKDLDDYSNQVKNELDSFYIQKYYNKKNLNWLKEKKAHTEGFDRIWLKYLDEEEKKKYENLI